MGTAAATRGGHPLTMVTRIKLSTALLYLAPAVLVVVAFYLYPIIFTVPVSFMRWDGVTRMTFTGLANIRIMFAGSEFMIALRNTFLWIAAATFVHTPLGLVIALLLHRKPRGWALLRTLFFLPNVLSAASIALLWYFLLNPTIGPIDAFLRLIGAHGAALAWLSLPGTALVGDQTPFVLYIGFTMLIFLAQMTVIPREDYEASEIDGASPLQQDLYVTLPLIRRAAVINILFNAAFCLKMIEYPLIMTSGGPGNATMTLSLYMYNAMTRAREFGLTMATGLITIVCGALLMGLVFGLQRLAERRWE